MSSSTSQVILDAGVLDVLLQIHICDNHLFYSSGVYNRDGGFAFQIASNSALAALGRPAPEHLERILNHPLHTMWPQAVDMTYMQLCESPIKSMTKRQLLSADVGRHLTARRLRSLEDFMLDPSKYDISDHFNTCIDLVELSR